MSQSDYSVNVLDIFTGELIDLLDQRRFLKLEYTRVINDIGQLTISLPIEDRMSGLRQKDTLFEVFRRDYTGTFVLEETYLMRYRNVFYDSETDKEYVVFGGVSLNHLLKRRIVRPTDDPLAAGGYSSKYARAESVMNEFVSQQLVAPFNDASRAMPNTYIESVTPIGQFVYQRRRFERLFEVIQDCAVKGQTDFRIYRASGISFVFSALPIGRDMSITTNFPTGNWLYFDENRGNLIEPSVIEDSYEEVNAVYVLGQGTGTNQQILLRSNAAVSDSPYNRMESTTDSRDTEIGVIQGLITAGDNFLNENQSKVTLDFKIDLTKLSTVYNKDWFLGDRITGAYQGVQKNVRIQAINVSVAKEGEDIQIVLDNKYDRGPN